MKRNIFWRTAVGAALIAFLVGAVSHSPALMAKLPGGGLKPSAGGSAGTVTSVTATAPFSISGTATTVPNVTSSGAGLSVLGRSSNTTGPLDVITASADGNVLRRSGTAIGWGAIPEASVTSLTTDLAALVPLTRTLTGTAPITVAGDNSAHDLSANRTIAIVAASGSVPGSMSAAHYVKLTNAFTPVRCPDLANADATVNPGTDNCSLYVVPASAPLSPTRAVTFSNTGLVSGLLHLVRVVRMDGGAGGLQIKRNDGTTLYTMVAGTIASKYPYFEIYQNGTNWAANTGGFVTDQ